jgi:excisionase family DNA binding protein
MEKLLLKPAEVTEMLGIARSRVYEMLTRRELPSVRIGTSVRIPAAALQQWIDERQVPANSIDRSD